MTDAKPTYPYCRWHRCWYSRRHWWCRYKDGDAALDVVAYTICFVTILAIIGVCAVAVAW